MIALGNANKVHSLHVNNFTDGTGTFIKSGNEMTCTANGTAYMPFKFVYGTWEFDVNKGSTNNQLVVNFISVLDTSGSSNYIILDVNEKLAFGRVVTIGTRLLESASNYVSNTTYYRIKITRSKANVFTVYIKGGTFTEWTLVSVSGGSGTNPVTDSTYTTSNYFMVDLDAGDKIGNITWKPYI